MSLPSPSLPPKVPTRSLAPVVLALLLGVVVIVVVIVKMSSSKAPAPEPQVASAAPKPPAAAAPSSAEPPPPPPGWAGAPPPPPSAPSRAAPRHAADHPPPPPPSGEAAPPPPPASEAVAAPGNAASDTAARAVASAQKAGGPRAARDSGCEAPCQGSATDQLVRALGSKAAQARACYERALANNSGLSGKLEIAVRVSPAGAVCSATPSSDTLKDPEVLGCVLGRIKSGILPKPTGGCVDASVPINFKPAGAG